MSPYKTKPVTIKITVNGNCYWVRGKTRKEAQEKAALKKAQIEAGQRVITGTMTVSEWAEIWLETYKRRKVNPHYYNDIRNQVRSRILPAIGGKKVKQVKPADCQAVLNEMTECSASYIRSVRDLLRGMFREAYRNDMVLHDPAEHVELPAGKPKYHRRSLTARERALTLQVAETNRGGLFVLIMLYCGLRPGEVAALRWSDVDMQKRVLHVTKAVKSDNTVGPPKTHAGIRDVPIPEYLYNKLSEIEHGPFDLVCTNSQGGRYTESSIYRMWRTFARDLNIAAGCRVFRNQIVPPYFVNDLTLYCYRHTYCTDLQSAGVPINVARELMGHASIEVTAQVYTHHSDDSFEDARRKIEAFSGSKVAPEVAPLSESVAK